MGKKKEREGFKKSKIDKKFFFLVDNLIRSPHKKN